MIGRRQFLARGGSLAALLPAPWPWTILRAEDGVEIIMRGSGQGAHVWFDPAGVLIRPGQRITWRNADPGNSHTVTAYHPDIEGRSRRWPKAAEPFDSGYLLPEESFSVILRESGVYDYYCVPHEHAGMVGRIVVAGGDTDAPQEAGDLPEVALTNFPDVEEILAKGVVRRHERS